MSYIDDETISMSARSKGMIDVSRIMRLFGGGGNEFSAAAKIKGKTLPEIKTLLVNSLKPGAFIKNFDLVPTDSQQMKLTMKNRTTL